MGQLVSVTKLEVIGKTQPIKVGTRGLVALFALMHISSSVMPLADVQAGSSDGLTFPLHVGADTPPRWHSKEL